jgi:predicted CopG family antitoxin
MIRTITVSDEIYKRLSALKGRDESFSELFERLTEGKGSHDILVKLRGSVEFRDEKKMLSEHYAS